MVSPSVCTLTLAQALLPSALLQGGCGKVGVSKVGVARWVLVNANLVDGVIWDQKWIESVMYS